MQVGFTKYCFLLSLSLCLWDSHAVSKHDKQKDWGSRNIFMPGDYIAEENLLVDMNKVLLPPLHIMFGLIKNFMKTLNKNAQYLTSVHCIPSSQFC